MFFLHLAGSHPVIAARMAQRSGHFMPTSLLESQFATLEPPAADEWAAEVDVDAPFAALIDTALRVLQRQCQP